MKTINREGKYHELLKDKKYLKIINKQINSKLISCFFIILIVLFLLNLIFSGSNLDTAPFSVKVMTYIFLLLMVLTAFIYSFTTIKSKIEILRGIYKLSVCSGLAVEKLKSHAGIHKVRFFINEVSENSTIPFNPKKKLDDFLIRKYKENGIQELKDGVFMIHSTTLDFYRKVPINKPINLIIYEPLGLLIFFELLE